MRLRALVWFSLVWLLLPLGVVAAQVYMSSVFLGGSSYPIAEQVRAYGSSVLVQPFTCLVACVAGLRLRQSKVLASVAVLRPRVAVVSQLVALPSIGATAVVVATMAMTSAAATQSIGVDPRLLAASAVQSAAFAAAGLALGLVLRPVLAVPLAVLLPYLLIAFPPASSVYWLRHLTGISSACCNIYEDLSTRALLAHIFFLLAVLIGAMATVFATADSTNRPRTMGAVASAGGGCMLLAVVSAFPLGSMAVDGRRGQPDCRPVQGAQLCLWPEHESMRTKAEAVVRDIVQIGATSGAAVPSKFTESEPSDVRWPATAVEVAPGATLATLRSSLASSLYPTTVCAKPTTSEGDATAAPDIDNGSVVQLWWEHQLGVRSDLPDQDPTAATEATRLQQLPRQEQVEAVNAMVRTAAAVCGTGPAS